MKIGIVIPALNEAKTVGGVIASVIEIGHVIVVDDGSTDGTSEVAEAAGATVVRHKENSGYDAALASGYARAIELDCDAVATIDADGKRRDKSQEGAQCENTEECTCVKCRTRRLERHLPQRFARHHVKMSVGKTTHREDGHC